MRFEKVGKEWQEMKEKKRSNRLARVSLAKSLKCTTRQVVS